MIRGCAIDSGFDPRRDRYRRPEHRVYRYCRINGGWAWAMKGVGQVPGGVKLTKTSKTAVLVLVESAHVKGLIDGELQSEERRLVFPSGVDREFAAQICADELLRLPSGKLAYDSKGRPDHYRDALMHAIALAMFFNLPLHYQQPEQQAHDIPAPRPARIAVNPGMHRGWTR